MGSTQDSLQKGLALYNNGNLNEALQIFESMVKRDSINDATKKYAGTVSLSPNNYDKALYYFSWLENQPDLYRNPGKIYHTLTLLQRNNIGDSVKTKALLKEMVEDDLEGKEDAARWLKKR